MPNNLVQKETNSMPMEDKKKVTGTNCNRGDVSSKETAEIVEGNNSFS